MAALLVYPLSGAPARDTAAPAAEEAPALPSSPADLFGALAKGVRPQWRPFFRETVPHAASDRFKAALSLGATCADCYLAAEARDAQQIRNLLTDMAALEMMLSINRQMSSQRQKLTELAAAGEWMGVRSEVTLLMGSHAQYLAEQKDEMLAELESIGCWLRAFHISAQFCAKQKRPPVRPCIWSGAMLSSLTARATKLSDARQDATLTSLSQSIARLEAVWAGETTATNAAARLETSGKLLDAMMIEFIAGEPPHSAPDTKPKP